jgi:hypothetical protein
MKQKMAARASLNWKTTTVYVIRGRGATSSEMCQGNLVTHIFNRLSRILFPLEFLTPLGFQKAIEFWTNKVASWNL